MIKEKLLEQGMKMKKQVTQLVAGDMIDPPNGERKWLWKDGTKRLYTVVSIAPGRTTKRGNFIRIFASCPSPYRDENFTTVHEMLETKIVDIRTK